MGENSCNEGYGVEEAERRREKESSICEDRGGQETSAGNRAEAVAELGSEDGDVDLPLP